MDTTADVRSDDALQPQREKVPVAHSPPSTLVFAMLTLTEAEEKAKKKREEREKSKPRPPPPSFPAAPPKPSSKKDGQDGDDMELDEEDLKIIQDTKKQGYCYFKRTLSEKDQSLLDAEQMKLRAVSIVSVHT